MATNLRLDERTAKALRDAAARAGTSQQQLIRDALETYLGLRTDPTERDQAISAGLVHAGTPYEDFDPFLELPDGMTSLDLLDRDDR